MGSLTLQYPPMSGGAAEQQLRDIRAYLYQLTDQLNGADWSAQTVLTEIAQAIDADALAEQERKTELAGWSAVKTLIIKTADFAAKNSEAFRFQLSGNYVAVSDFGVFQEEMKLALDANESAITQTYDYAALIERNANQQYDALGEYTKGINNKLTVNSKQYVKTGLLYYDGVVPVYGVGVGNLETTVSNGQEILDQTKNELLTVTSGRIGFWQNGQEVAYLSEKKLHFPSGTLEAYDATLSGTVTAAAGSSFGPWNISETSIYRTDNTWGGNGLYFGTDGLSIQAAFKVDATGKMTATGAEVSGTIKANDLLLKNGDKYSSVNTQLKTLVDSVSELAVLAEAVSLGAGGNASGFDFYVDGVGGLQITGATSSAYAVELSSTGALRLKSGTGAVYAQNGAQTASAMLTADGDVKMKGSKFYWNDKEVALGASTATAVFG